MDIHLLNPFQCRNPNDFPHFSRQQASFPFLWHFPVGLWPLPVPVQPQHRQPPARPAAPCPTPRAQDKAKLQFPGLIARMPMQGRDRDPFVPAPSASVPGERLITDLALCAQPWLDTVCTSSWADKDKMENSWRFWVVRYLLEQPSDTVAPVVFSSWARIRKSSRADIPEGATTGGSWAALPHPERQKKPSEAEREGKIHQWHTGELGSSRSIHPWCSPPGSVRAQPHPAWTKTRRENSVPLVKHMGNKIKAKTVPSTAQGAAGTALRGCS